MELQQLMTLESGIAPLPNNFVDGCNGCILRLRHPSVDSAVLTVMRLLYGLNCLASNVRCCRVRALGQCSRDRFILIENFLTEGQEILGNTTTRVASGSLNFNECDSSRCLLYALHFVNFHPEASSDILPRRSIELWTIC